jgi:predicted transcriptional regulator
MKEVGYLLSLKHSLWHVVAGTRGGITRIQIIELLRKRPYNMNQLHEKLGLDYKTIQHHIRVLTDENIIMTEDRKKYGSMCFISPLLEENIYLLDEILEKIGKKEINRRGKK